MHPHERYWQAKKVTIIGAVVNALLGLVKLLGGIGFHSHALVADGIHSFSDLITDIMVLFASKYGSLDADDSHPYGHKRIETATTFILALLLIIAGTGIAWDSIHEIMLSAHQQPGTFALPIAILSIIANEALFHYTRFVGEQIHSELIIANAWHHRSDAASSGVVVFGLIGSLMGWPWFDAVAAIIVGCMIIHMGLSYGWSSIKELVDTAVDSTLLNEITQTIQVIPGVEKVHQLRTRMMGGDIFIDVHILVSPIISVSEGHFIAQHVHKALIEDIERVKDVTVHVDPEDDEICKPSFHLPSRQIIELEFIKKWQAHYPCIQHWTLHYLEGHLSIDLICDQTHADIDALQHLITSDLITQKYISTVRLLRQTASLAILATAQNTQN